jgi:PIN domain nuclease of toxin-antitoxin system
VWIFIEPNRFTEKARIFLQDTETHNFFLSDASVWEASIKFGLGKLKLPEGPETFFPDRVRRAEYDHLRIDLSHAASVHSLPLIHRDPFDRLLITQSKIENMTLITADEVFMQYDTNILTLPEIS